MSSHYAETARTLRDESIAGTHVDPLVVPVFACEFYLPGQRSDQYFPGMTTHLFSLGKHPKCCVSVCLYVSVCVCVCVCAALNTKESVDAIVSYCREQYEAKDVDRDATIGLTRDYVKDTTNMIGEHLITIGNHLTAFINEQLSTIEDTRHRVELMSTRLKVVQLTKGETYNHTLVAQRPRPVKHRRMAKLDDARLPALARPLPEWNHAKLDYDQYNKIGKTVNRSGGADMVPMAMPSAPSSFTPTVVEEMSRTEAATLDPSAAASRPSGAAPPPMLSKSGGTPNHGPPVCACVCVCVCVVACVCFVY
jgi:hypothetical protein